jgi:DNA-directed RNA polymerase subunit RPC12/RpoP
MPYPPNQRFALALAGVITELDHAHHDALGGWGDNANTRPWCTKRLSEFYGIESTEELVRRTNDFLNGGHSAAARATLASLPDDASQDDPHQALVRAHRAEIERVGVFAWDVGRLIAVLGWSAWAGYVAELEAWQVMMVAAARAQRAYDSWASFAEGYELGRLYWAKGAAHEPTARILEKLKTDPESPWNTLAWNLDLGVRLGEPAAPPKTRFKRTVCPACGAPKGRPSVTGFVYCDYCGSLSDFDFAKACEKPLARPGPVYEKLVQEVTPLLNDALAKGDRDAYRAVQSQIFEAYLVAAPDSAPPRVRDPAYRKKYVAYMAEALTVPAFDAEAKTHDTAVREATAKLSFSQPEPGVMRVEPASFRAFADVLFAQQDYAAKLLEAHGVYAMQPDGATPALQRHMSISAFAQAWLPMLDEANAADLLARTGLKGEYIEADPAPTDASTCGACGASLRVFKGARRMVCEHCGSALDVEGERVRCAGCGASLAPPEGSASFACPHCSVAVQRIEMMKPA